MRSRVISFDKLGRIQSLVNEAIQAETPDATQDAAMRLFHELTGRHICVDDGTDLYRLRKDIGGDLKFEYDKALDEMQASIVLAGGSKRTHAELENTSFGDLILTAVRNRIRIRTIYQPRPDEF